MSKKTFNDIHEINTRLDELRGVMSEATMDAKTNLLKQKSAVLSALTNKAGDTDGLPNLDALKTIKLNKDIFGNYVSAVKSVLLHEKQVSAFCVEQLEKIEEQCVNSGVCFRSAKIVSEALEEQFMYGKRLSFDDVFDMFSSVEREIGDLEDVVWVDDGKPQYSVSKENANVIEAFDETPQSTFRTKYYDMYQTMTALRNTSSEASKDDVENVVLQLFELNSVANDSMFLSHSISKDAAEYDIPTDALRFFLNSKGDTMKIVNKAKRLLK